MQVFQQKFVIIFLFLFTLFLSFPKCMASAIDTENGTKILVLNYHKVDNTDIPLSVSPEYFDAQLKYLIFHDYHSITPEQLMDYLENGTELPKNPVLITFDDGYLDNYTYAYPILLQNGFRATFFIIPDLVGTTKYSLDYFDWEQAKEMLENGINIESHTLSHASLSKLSVQDAKNEIANSQKIIEDHLGKKPLFLAYPCGSYNSIITGLAQECGYRAAFTIRQGLVDIESDPYALERITIVRNDRVFRGFTTKIRYTPNFEKFGWITP